MESEAVFTSIENKTRTQFKSLMRELQKTKANLTSYEANGLPQAQLLLKQSQRGFKEGAIGYMEYVQGLNRALNIQAQYLTFINKYNQKLIQIENLIAIQ